MKNYLFAILLLALSACSGTARQPQASTAHITIGDTVASVGSSIRCIFQDKQNRYWFATDGEGLYSYDGKTIGRFTAKHGLPCNFVWQVRQAPDGTIWANTRDGICYFDGSKFIPTTAQDTVMQTTPLNSTSMLLGGYYYTGHTLVNIKLPHTSPFENSQNAGFQYDIYATCLDNKGILWIGTCTAGVCTYDGHHFTWLNDKQLAAPVRTIFQDKKGNIWIGNNGHGLLRYDGKTLSNITKELRLENPDFIAKMAGKDSTLARVWTITDDKEGNLWIGTIDAGVWKYDGTSIVNYTTKNGLGANAIWTIYRDNNDQLWFGTDGAGLYKFDGHRFSKAIL